MTMIYTGTLSEQEYIKAHAASVQQESAKSPAEAPEAVTELPDMSEAERIWKLLCQSAQNG